MFDCKLPRSTLKPTFVDAVGLKRSSPPSPDDGVTTEGASVHEKLAQQLQQGPHLLVVSMSQPVARTQP